MKHELPTQPIQEQILNPQRSKIEMYAKYLNYLPRPIAAVESRMDALKQAAQMRDEHNKTFAIDDGEGLHNEESRLKRTLVRFVFVLVSVVLSMLLLYGLALPIWGTLFEILRVRSP